MAPPVTLNTKVFVPAQTTAAPVERATKTTQSAEQTTGQVPVDVVDTFHGAQSAAPAELTGAPPQPSASRLASDLSTVVDGLKLPEQMGYDLAVQYGALTGSPTLPREEKAGRLMEFMVPYGERLATLAQGLSADQRSAVAAQLLKHMTAAGLGKVVELTTQRTGLQVGQAMLSANKPDDVRKALEGMKFDSTDPTALVGAATVRQEGAVPVALNQQPVAPSRKSVQGEAEDAGEGSKRRGGPMWGMLHRGRSEQGRLDEGEKWVPDEKGLYAAGLAALVISLGIAALLTLFR